MLELTQRYQNLEGYLIVATSIARSAIRNACGEYTAREFQTMRSSVSKTMEDYIRADLKNKVSTTVLSLNLKNIDRPQGYQDAVSVSEQALADIELARKQEEQELIKANTALKVY